MQAGSGCCHTLRGRFASPSSCSGLQVGRQPGAMPPGMMDLIRLELLLCAMAVLISSKQMGIDAVALELLVMRLPLTLTSTLLDFQPYNLRQVRRGSVARCHTQTFDSSGRLRASGFGLRASGFGLRASGLLEQEVTPLPQATELAAQSEAGLRLEDFRLHNSGPGHRAIRLRRLR